jgi:hypothetical protein
MPTLVHTSGRTGIDRRRAAGVAAVWVIAAAVVLLFARVTAIGPVLLTFYGTHGVHLADLVVLLVAVVVAARLTVRLVRRG